jgi:hypothetical protein
MEQMLLGQTQFHGRHKAIPAQGSATHGAGTHLWLQELSSTVPVPDHHNWHQFPGGLNAGIKIYSFFFTSLLRSKQTYGPKDETKVPQRDIIFALQGHVLPATLQ